MLTLFAGCGRDESPTSPAAPTSFLVGTWRGTVAIQVNPGDPDAPPPTNGSMTWTFGVVPQTNQQTFHATIRSTHPWLAMKTTASTALSPSNMPPAQISTLGDYPSPRGCRGTFGSVGTARTTRIEADFTGTDCDQMTFTGSLVLTKE
ncbi:MAG: hypothetical protein ACRD2X_00060 [Vicinamibacteraceae bacterium]